MLASYSFIIINSHNFSKLFTNNYHLYINLTLFIYDIILRRNDLHKNKHETYYLRVCFFSFCYILITLFYSFYSFLRRSRCFILSSCTSKLQLYESRFLSHYYTCFVKNFALNKTFKTHILALEKSS